MSQLKNFCFLFILICSFNSKAQLKYQFDSLLKSNRIKLENGNLKGLDTTKLSKTASELTNLLFTNTKLVDTLSQFFTTQLKSKKLSDKETEILNRFYLALGNSNSILNRYKKAEKAYKSILENSQSEVSQKVKAEANMGILSYLQYNYTEAANHYLKSIEISKQNNLRCGQQYANLCLLYQNIGNYEKDLEYGFIGLEYAKKFHDSEVEAFLYNIIGYAYKQTGNSEKALLYYNKSLDLAVSQSYDNLADVTTNLGVFYSEKNDFKKSLEYFNSAIKYNNKIDRSNFLVNTHLSHLYLVQGNLTKAKNFLDEAQVLIEPTTSLENKYQFYLFKSDYYNRINNHQLAYKNLLIVKKLQDSISVEAKNNGVRNLQQNYAIREMRLSDSLEFAIKEKSITEKNRLNSEKKNAQLKFQKGVLIFSIVFALLLLATIIYVFKMYKNKKAVNEIIAVQKDAVEHQKTEISEKNKELTDSITYAKNLQNAMIPTMQSLQANFNDLGLLYLPKDIVSGDFYWTHKAENDIYIAVADCTGHGVPGAMMSLIGINGLERCVKEYHITEPAEILNQLSILVEETFSNHSYGINDGMDLSLIKFNSETRILTFAGAYNPLWIFHKEKIDGLEAFESVIEKGIGNTNESVNYYSIPANKQPIGKFRDRSPFIQKAFYLPENAKLVLLTDGYADQFGGSNEKKLKYANLRNVIVNNLEDKSKIITEKLKVNFENWKENLEQVDDVTIIVLNF